MCPCLNPCRFRYGTHHALSTRSTQSTRRKTTAKISSFACFVFQSFASASASASVSARNQDLDEIPDIGLELVVAHARLSDLCELDEADVGRVGEARAVRRGDRVES